MKISSRSPLLWTSATILSGLLYYFAFHFFPQTFPLIHLNITADRQQVLENADRISKTYNLGPAEYHNAAMFVTDSNVQTFVELEAGGKDAFVAMMDEKLYMPYYWQVRHFKEHEKNEVSIKFTPDGTPYGFVERLSDNSLGAQLSSTDARAIAEKDAATHWNINFSEYTLVESSQKTVPSERIDHTFVYERTNKKIGEGLYRLKITVSGDKLTEITPHVKVPESFTRRYAEMRSANTTIAWAAHLLMQILYLIGGCFGLFWLIRKRWLIFKAPLFWSIFLSLASVLTSINQLPTLWMYYSTAYSQNGFLMHLFLNFLIQFLTQTAFYMFIITTAESLTRHAFGHHPQLWSLFTTHNRTSFATLGRMCGGYLLVGFNCAFVIAFYLFSTRYLGWWNPSEMLFDPNILATYMPWFSPLAQSFNAGFTEECLYRAIPLAGAALLGNYFGKRNWWIGTAFIVQAIIFGAAHASYPVQPSYARLVELFIPSLIWGATYLRFGLLPTIIAHYVYDVIWFSLPIFVSHAPYSLMYQIIIILFTLLPLLYVLAARIKAGMWSELPITATNRSWQPPVITQATTTHTTSPDELYTLTPRTRTIMLCLQIIGLFAWLWLIPFTHDGVTITKNREQAIEQANNFLHQKNITLTAPWKTLPLVFTDYTHHPTISMQHTFIWREYDKQLYHSLLGSYLESAHWTVRYAQFDTDILQRAEEYKVMFYDATIYNFTHTLPEGAAGAELTQEQARVIAHTTITQNYNLDPTTLTEISAEQTQLPHRKNWVFTFANPAIPLTKGQARIAIAIAGDCVIDAKRFIHVPEEWERAETHQQSMLYIIRIIFTLITIFFLLFALFLAFCTKKTVLFSKKLFFALSGIIALVACTDIINAWPLIIGSFHTSLPFNNQLFQSISSYLLSAGIKSVVYALAISYILIQKRVNRLSSPTALFMGIASGLISAGLLVCAKKIVYVNLPQWPHYDALNYAFPLIESTIDILTQYMTTTITISFLCTLLDMTTHGLRKHRIFFTIFSALCGMTMLKASSLTMVPLWIAVGTIMGIMLLALYRYIIRADLSIIPIATGSFILLRVIRQGLLNAYPGAMLAMWVQIIVVIGASSAWYWYMNIKNE